MSSSPSTSADRPRSDRTTRWFVIGFAIVEAIIIGWALFAGVAA